MAIKFSTGLRNAMLGGSSLKAALANGFIHIYASAAVDIPANADAAIDTTKHTKLMTVYGDAISAGLNLGTADAGAIGKSASESWGGTVLVAGDAVFFRYVGSADTGAASTAEVRMQGRVGVSGAELNMSSLSLVAGTSRQVNFATIAIPSGE